MVYEKLRGRSHLKHWAVHTVRVSGQAGVTQVTAGMASFWMEKGKKKETKPAER